MSLAHLHILAATANLAASEQGGSGTAAATTPQKAGASAWGANGDGCNSLAATFAMDVEDEPQSRPAARSSTDSHHHRSGAGTGGVGKHHKHRAAEAKRRERINERLQALRELVPHDQRSNTATFLEGVISYIKTLQDSNAQLEAQLISLQAMRAAAAAHLEQHQELLAQPAGSGSNAAHSGAVQHQHQQQCFNSNWRQDSITGPAPASPAATAAAAAAQWQGAANGSSQQPQQQHDDVTDAARAIQALQQHFQQPEHQQLAGHASDRQACSSSPPLPHTAVAAGVAAAAAAGPASTTLSAPAALTHTLAQHTPGAMDAVTEGGTTPTAATSGLLPPPGSLQLPAVSDSAAASLQPAELQVVLEKALLAALQQQAQQLASQLLSRGP